MKLLTMALSILFLSQSYALEGFKGVVTFDNQYISKKDIVKIHYLNEEEVHFYNIDTVELQDKSFIHFNDIKNISGFELSNSVFMAREGGGTSGGD